MRRVLGIFQSVVALAFIGTCAFQVSVRYSLVPYERIAASAKSELDASSATAAEKERLKASLQGLNSIRSAELEIVGENHATLLVGGVILSVLVLASRPWRKDGPNQ